MGTYLPKITEDIKTAMRAKDRLRLDVLRMVVTAIREEQFQKKVDELSDEDELVVLMRAVKTRKESVVQALEVGRPEIADKENAEIEIVSVYLPTQMTGDELLAKVKEVAASVGFGGAKDTGKFMKEWMAQYKGKGKGKADGREVQEALKTIAAG